MNSIRMWASILAVMIAGIVAPVVCLFYRNGWFNTPDDPDSPHGQSEPTMRAILASAGTWFCDWWWLGVRNRAQGLAYALKPRYFKELKSYDDLLVWRSQDGNVQKTGVLHYTEYARQFGWFHVIWGYRMSPIFGEVMNNRAGAGIPFRQINMDARPIFTLRGGKLD